jgi:hypothetical protein
LAGWPGFPKKGEPPTGRKPTPYLLALLAQIYRCTVLELIDLADREHMPPADLLIIDTYTTSNHPAGSNSDPDRQAILELRNLIHPGRTAAGPIRAALTAPQLPSVAYRWIQEPDMGDSGIEREVLMTAHEGSDYAERAEQRDIGEATLEQVRDDVTRLSHAYMTGEPFPVFREMRRVRNRMYAALERRLWPRDQGQLYFLLGGLSGLMAHAANDLGYPQAADELVRAGWAYAVAIDHRPLMGFLRGQQATTGYWHGRFQQASYLVQDGLRYLPVGSGAIRLHCLNAMAAARLGQPGETRAAIAASHQIREHDHRDELHDEIGGEFACPPAKESYFAGTALTDLHEAEPDAITELQTAIRLFQAGPDEERSYGCEAIAHINLALVQLRHGDLDAIDLTPVLALPPDKRIDALPQRLTAIRAELATARYQSLVQARDLSERIEEFSHDTIGHELHELPLGPS